MFFWLPQSTGSHGNELISSGDFGADSRCDDVDADDVDGVSARCLDNGQTSDSLILPFAELSTAAYVYCYVFYQSSFIIFSIIIYKQ